MNKKYNDPVYQLIFEKIVCQIKLHTESDAKMGDVCGLFTGEASLIYTYLLLYKITEDDSYLIYAQKQADKMMESDAFKIDGDDLLSGKAGVIIAYLELYGVTDSRKYLEFAIIIGDLLLDGAGKREKGIGWFNLGQSNLAGMAHGNSGIALAIAFLWKYCKSEKYIHYIKAAIDYEDTLYDAKLCNWLDIRECDRYGEGKDMAAWCHGCGGIYLARKRIHELTGIPLEELFYVFVPNKEDYDTCLGKKLFAAKKENSCLCHGSLGIYALLKQIDVPSMNKGTHGRRRTNFCSCCVTFLPRTSSTRQSSALQEQKLVSFRLYDSDHRYLGDFQGGQLRRTGRTPIEDNAENHLNIMVQGVCSFVH